jgi:PleD family two-component response regulator
MDKEKVTILIADDEKPLRDALIAHLSANGFGTFSAGDGEQCVSIATESLPDLILLDIEMPKMNGYEVIERLRANVKTKEIPIILLTNVESYDMIAYSVDLGVSDYLIKSEMQLTDVVDTIRGKLGIKTG